MSATTLLKLNTANGNGTGQARNWFSPLNLHWAGVGLLVLVNLYLLAHMALLWHGEKNYNADAQAEQRIELKTAGAAAAPLRGLDTKVAAATREADRFYAQRLPRTESDILAELGALSKKSGVRLMRVQYASQGKVLAGTDAELTEAPMDATLSGDYRPLVLFINSLERDKMFFVIKTVTLTGQQTGTVSLRLRLTTYLREGGAEPSEVDAARPQAGDVNNTGAANGGLGR
jgi:type IV pilus assembly protein PilO